MICTSDHYHDPPPPRHHHHHQDQLQLDQEIDGGVLRVWEVVCLYVEARQGVTGGENRFITAQHRPPPSQPLLTTFSPLSFPLATPSPSPCTKSPLRLGILTGSGGTPRRARQGGLTRSRLISRYRQFPTRPTALPLILLPCPSCPPDSSLPAPTPLPYHHHHHHNHHKHNLPHHHYHYPFLHLNIFIPILVDALEIPNLEISTKHKATSQE